MPLVGSGEISIGGSTPGRSINLEFGRAANATTSMSQLYRGGGIVPNATANNAIPTSGTISLSQFYGATNRVSINIVLSTNQTNYVLNTAKAPGYVAGISDITLIINSGVYVSSNNTSVPALVVDTSWAAGDTITIVNNGFIIGMGGAGGAGDSIYNGYVGVYNGAPAGTAGAAGGLALRAQRAVSVNNAGTIGGGGGGGGGGGAAFVDIGSERLNYAGGGGGGGRSNPASNASGGIGGAASGSSGSRSGSAGGAGTVSSPGGGGSGGAGSGGRGGGGGGGGNWGASGASGAAGSGLGWWNGHSGGSGGAAVNGNANITWIATGTRLGAIT